MPIVDKWIQYSQSLNNDDDAADDRINRDEECVEDTIELDQQNFNLGDEGNDWVEDIGNGLFEDGNQCEKMNITNLDNALL